MPDAATKLKTICYHCGLDCPNDTIQIDDKFFCCSGCKTVFQLLRDNDLTGYYNQQTFPGVTPDTTQTTTRFAYLDDPKVKERLIDFSDGRTARITLQVPQIHCTSCIWLLENLYRLHQGVTQSEVNFLRRQVMVVFDEAQITLRQLIELLASLGYEPSLTLDSLDKKPVDRTQRSLYTRIAVAGFAFANIMLFSFPEYLALESLIGSDFARLFGYFSLVLSLPVLFYSASGYFTSAFTGLKHRKVNIDVPITLGMAVLFTRSLYEILAGSGSGYLDSFAGLVFFLLLGKLFQQKTYASLAFDRDYQAYFPISITKKENNQDITVPVTSLEPGDTIVVRNQEIIPADALLTVGAGLIDYSFVTGESEPQEKKSGQRVSAGGRQVGSAIELKVIKRVSQSYLTQLWNHSAFARTKDPRIANLANAISKYFTAAVLTVAAAAAWYWIQRDIAIAMNAVTSVLIIACPCALALSSPFVLGTAMRILGKHRFYLKNTAVVEQLARTDTIVFDKTGTLTQSGVSEIHFVGSPLTDYEKRLILSLVRHSAHPLSRLLGATLTGEINAVTHSPEFFETNSFMEEVGRGIGGMVDKQNIRIGNARWVDRPGQNEIGIRNQSGTVVYLSIDGSERGCFLLTTKFRPELQSVVTELGGKHTLSLLSGDNDNTRPELELLFGHNATLLFNQSLYDKLQHVEKLQSRGQTVTMVGDGLNDAGALRQADVGISISEDTASFSPACDGILDAGSFSELPMFIKLAKRCLTIIVVSFIISFLYNAVGLSFAVTGKLAPVVSAILMPLSSISVVLFATITTRLAAGKIGLR